MTAMRVRHATVGDLEEIAEIYNELIPTRTVTWTGRLDTLDDRRGWFAHQQADGYPVIVAESDGEVVGFAAYGAFRDNAKWPGYRHTVELSIHVRGDRWGRGVGRALMTALIERAEQDGVHVMIAAVDSDNPESIAFHERMGFRVAGRLEEIGTKFGRWLDLVLLQRTFDREPPSD